MEEFLPNISLKTDCDERLFLSRINSLQKYFCEINKMEYLQNEVVEGEDSIILEPKILGGNEDLALLIFNLENNKSHVYIELHISELNGISPTYNLYVSEVKRIFTPILKLYNKHFHSRLRLKIESKKSLEIYLPPKAKFLFNRFANNIKKNISHPSDWERFYLFVWHCHSKNVKINSDEMEILLLQTGFQKNNAKYITDVYTRIRDFLSFHKANFTSSSSA